MAKARILVVEDEALFAGEIHSALTGLGYDVTGIASSGEEAIGRAAEMRPDLVIMDIVLKGSIDGVTAAEHVSSRLDIPVVFLSAHADETTLHRAKITEPYGYILKPFEERGLRTAVEMALYRHRMEKKLKESEEVLKKSLEKAEAEAARTEAIIAAIGDGISIQDTSFRILYQNQIHKGFVGDHTGEYCYQAYECRDTICEGCPVAMSFRDGRIHTVERSSPSGTLHVEITASPVTDASGKIIAGIEMARDITKRKQAQDALRESEERYRNLFENAHDMIQSVDVKGRFIFANTAWLRTLGYTQDDLRQMTLFDLIHPDCRDHCLQVFHRVMTGEPVDNIEATFIAKDGRPVHVEGNVNVRSAGGSVIATQGIFRDVTARKKAEADRARLEAHLLRAQKMEAIGTLTGGIAHEFNNIMTAIIGYGDFLLEGTEEDSPLRTYVNMIQASAARATNLTQGLLTYSRKQVTNPKPVNLNESVRNVERLLSRLIGENISLTCVLAEEDIVAMADPGQLEQVLINLATNARDAMPGGGTLEIQVSRSEHADDLAREQGNGKPGACARLTVKDTGSGMDERTKERIFEPFFTTKEAGKGTGLGLAMVYGIIKQHDGHIAVQSEQGKGTTVVVDLPLLRRTAEDRAAGSPLPSKQGSETVLVAEDDAAVRKLMQAILERSGYRVITAEDGQDAIAKFLEKKDTIQLLLLDVMMPRKNGKEAYREISAVSPGVKVMFLSGHTWESMKKDGFLEEGTNFFSKPISPDELSRRVREILDR